MRTLNNVEMITLNAMLMAAAAACGSDGAEVVSRFGDVTVAGIRSGDRVDTVLSDHSGEARLTVAFDGVGSAEIITLWDGATSVVEIDASAADSDVFGWNRFTYDHWMSIPHPGEASSDAAVVSTRTTRGTGIGTETTSGGTSSGGTSTGGTSSGSGSFGFRCGDPFVPEYNGGTSVTGSYSDAQAAATAMCNDTSKRTCSKCGPGLPTHVASNGIGDDDDTWSIHCVCN